MTLPIADFREIKLCILQYGADVTVIKPEDLKTEIADEIRKMSQLYAEGYEGIKQRPGQQKETMYGCRGGPLCPTDGVREGLLQPALLDGEFLKNTEKK